MIRELEVGNYATTDPEDEAREVPKEVQEVEAKEVFKDAMNTGVEDIRTYIAKVSHDDADEGTCKRTVM